MLPFLKRAKEAGAAGPVEAVTREHDEGTEFGMDGLEVAAQDVIDAVHAKNATHLASALRAAFDLLDSEPHEEAANTNG